jgi:protein FrlC
MNFKDKLCGMNSHYRFYSFERFFQEMNRLGIKNVEIWTGPMHFYVDYNKNQSVEQLKEYAKKYDVKIIGICPEQTNPKPNNVASPSRQEDVYALLSNGGYRKRSQCPTYINHNRLGLL